MEPHITLRQLSAYVDGEVAGQSRADIEAHVAQCAACRDALEQMQSQWRQLADEASPAVPPYFYTRLRARMESQGRLRRVGQPGWLVAISVGVALILGFILGTLTGRQWHASPDNTLKAQLAATVTDIPENSLGDAYLTLADIH